MDIEGIVKDLPAEVKLHFQYNIADEKTIEFFDLIIKAIDTDILNLSPNSDTLQSDFKQLKKKKELIEELITILFQQLHKRKTQGDS